MKVLCKHVVTPILASLLVACGGSGSSSRPVNPGPNPAPPASDGIAAEYRGIWVSPAYGRAIRIGASQFELFDYTSEFCLVRLEARGVDTGDVESLVRLEQGQLVEFGSNGTAEFSAPGEIFQSAESLPAPCANGVLAKVGEPGYERDSQRDLRLYYQLLNEYSIYPALRQVDLEAPYQRELDKLAIDDSDEALVDALYELTEPLADAHTEVSTDQGIIKVTGKPTYEQRLIAEYLTINQLEPPISADLFPEINAYVTQQSELEADNIIAYAADGTTVRTAANEQLLWFQNNGVGYLGVRAMTGFASGDEIDNADELAALESALNAALSDLQDTQGIIVDVRRNGGGQDFLSLAITRRFLANVTHLYSKQARLGDARTALREVHLEPSEAQRFLKPVVLLTSSHTASGAEVFALAMRNLDQVTVLGESTQGVFSDALEKQLSNGYDVRLANEYYLSPQGEWFESLGIPVDVEVPQFNRELRIQGVDAGIEAAFELLTES